MLYREWDVLTPENAAATAISQQVGLCKLLGKVLSARGIKTPEEAQELLREDDTLPDPFSIKDMDKAVMRIHQAVENGESIVVFGDYDVDGITATALMYTYLEGLGAQVFYKLPTRSDDGYGLSASMVESMADRGITVIITVDNGTTAFEAAACAKQRGVALIVTDHHLPYDTLPEVEALVNPCRADDDSGLAGLSGAGVAFMVLAGLEGCAAADMLEEFGELAAIGTVADVMKLVGPNRAIVRAGLAALQNTQRPGLRALIDACGWAGKAVTVENISFGIAPRLNAAGRMDDATTALQLLLCEDEDEAQAMVEGLQEQNAARQKAEQEILAMIAQQMEADTDLQHSRVLVIWGEGWHQGVIGIVASRLVDKYAKPAIAISFEGEAGKGSGRSMPGFSLHGAIASCEDILIRYGGHDLAAGFSLNKEFAKQFRKRVNKWAAENNPVPALPKLVADAEVELEELTLDEVQGLERLAPCGSGNPAPKLMLRGVTVDAVYPVSEGKHSRLRLRKNSSTLYAVLFGTGPDQLPYPVGMPVDVLVSVSVYAAGKAPMVSARITEIRPAGMDNAHVGQSALFESFLAGMPPDEDRRQLLAPSREDVAAIYRQVRGGIPVSFADLRPAFSRLGDVLPGRVLTALAALEELGLIVRDVPTGRYQPVQVAGKKDLETSALLRRLRPD